MASNTPEQVAPPALPQSTPEYNRQFQDQYSNVLRIYFNRLSSVLGALLSSVSGGAAIFFPTGTFKSFAIQSPVAVDTATPITLEQTPIARGISVLAGNTDVELSFRGVYTVNIILQMHSLNGTSKNILVWVKKNGVGVPYSAQQVTFAKIGFGQLIYTRVIEAEPNDVLQFDWAVSNLNIQLEATAPTAVHPGIASATVSISFASNVEL